MKVRGIFGRYKPLAWENKSNFITDKWIETNDKAKLCIDFPDPTNPYEQVAVECPPTPNNDVYVKRETVNFFQVTHNCSASVALCNKIKVAFNDAGKELTKILKLKQIINVNSTFTSLAPTTLGSAYSARYVPLISDDKITRLYPQALVKQFCLNPCPEYNAYDISARFNSDFDWWFRTDNETIKSDQYDFYAVLLHELIHGLGFISSWSNSLETLDNRNTTGITPDFGYSDNIFSEFSEYIFDRYVKFIRNNVVCTSTDYTFQLNKAVENGTSFNDYSEFVTKMKSSPQWKYAESALKCATTNDSMYFTPAKDTSWNDKIYLETSFNPIVSGSSISHVSDERYEPTEDFLMTYSFAPGESLEYLIQKGGNYKSPIGPRILSILESIGYETDTYSNPIKPTYEY
ncbi:hypothetical protein Glove_553g48 [Diversispora epigaea]|uniref:Sequence orphan n=1 Tax=Diversispora epigaea TaxID=1348612 RepID=A0A397GBB4_9GLOM|nr:hypothetical protein Glove_553g48 [Diversispora epigaea]